MIKILKSKEELNLGFALRIEVFVKEQIVKKIKIEENELFTILKELRMNISMEEKIPPYMIFGDSTLKELSNRMPITDEQFLDISGVGNSKLNKYGEKFMEKIKFVFDDTKDEVEFFVLEQTKVNGNSYILVTDSEEDEAECLILKDTSAAEDVESLYEVVEDENELMGVLKVFEELLEDIDIDM